MGVLAGFAVSTGTLITIVLVLAILIGVLWLVNHRPRR